MLLTWSPHDQKLDQSMGNGSYNHTCGRQAPILALDMYEHSYHMDYGARAAAYVDAFMATINWPNVGGAFARASA